MVGLKVNVSLHVALFDAHGLSRTMVGLKVHATRIRGSKSSGLSRTMVGLKGFCDQPQNAERGGLSRTMVGLKGFCDQPQNAERGGLSRTMVGLKVTIFANHISIKIVVVVIDLFKADER